MNSFHLTSPKKIDQEAYQGSKYFAIKPRGLKIISRSTGAEFRYISTQGYEIRDLHTQEHRCIKDKQAVQMGISTLSIPSALYNNQ